MITTLEDKIQLLRNTGFFSESDPEIVEAFANEMQEVRVPAGQNIVKKGDPGDGMYVIYQGAAKVHFEELTVAEFGDNDVFGELAIFDSSPRNMSVSATKDSTLYFITQEAFNNIMGESIRNSRGFVNVLINRLRGDNDRKIEQFKQREEELTALVNERTEELRETNKELVKAQKHKEEFLANMSHEIRTPMNAVVGMTNLLLGTTDLNEEQLKYLDAIKQSSKNLLVIINDILDFSKIEAGKLEIEEAPFSFRKVVDELVNTMGFKTDEKGLELKTNIDEQIPDKLLGDRVRLSQIIINLMGNAIKFTTEGSVTLDCELKNKTEETAEIYFQVIDTGIGIAEDKLEQVFGKFTQAESDTTRKFGGTGLGLSISKQLVELMGGTIGVKSTLGEGTTFFFSLELPIDKTTEETTETTEAAPTEKLKDLNILLADDDHYNQIVGQKTLEMLIEGVQVDVAENGKVAVEKASTKPYDIILMDINMPEMDGYEATTRIRNLGTDAAKTCIMAMTASATKNELERCTEAGMNDYITKPFIPQDLYDKIEELLTK